MPSSDEDILCVVRIPPVRSFVRCDVGVHVSVYTSDRVSVHIKVNIGLDVDDVIDCAHVYVGVRVGVSMIACSTPSAHV